MGELNLNRRQRVLIERGRDLLLRNLNQDIPAHRSHRTFEDRLFDWQVVISCLATL